MSQMTIDWKLGNYRFMFLPIPEAQSLNQGVNMVKFYKTLFPGDK